MQQLPDALAALGSYRQFITYKVVGRDKLPCDYRTGKVVSAHDPQYWTTASEAIATGQPVGFVFTEQDPFWFLDIDSCLSDNKWSELANQLCSALAGCAVEISQSGRGLHLFGTGRIPPHGCKNEALGLELYHTGRFVALTGTGAIGDCSHDAIAVLPALVQTYFPPDASTLSPASWRDGPVAEWRGPSDDRDLIRRAMQSKSAASVFGGKASFADLWIADERALSVAFPDALRAYDASSADSALAQHLAFWTGKDCVRIERLMRQSKLVRDKWEREDYLPRTILAVTARQVDVLIDKPSAPLTVEVTSVRNVTWETILGADEQIKQFAGCVYVSDVHRIFMPDGALLKPEQFKVRFGGFQFAVDPGNEKLCKDAWEAFTQTRLLSWPKVEGTCFKPDLSSGSISERDGQKFVNTYVPVVIDRKKGDVSPFLVHMERVLPDPHDRQILLSYMAACVQHKGVKFQWAPLLQGVEGNGKTFFSTCVAEAVGRRYTHFPPAHEISEKFNSWLFDNIFIGVEDIYVPNQKQEVFEILKPMITSRFLARRAMQTDQVMREIVANFIFNSNHQDGMKKTRNDRRICTLFCAQQKIEDLRRDKMDGDYMPSLYRWLKGGGHSIVNEFLHTYEIADALNPATHCQWAPTTTSTETAIRAGRGAVEQEIEEAIAQEMQGFSGGWVSTIWLGRLLEALGMARRITLHKRKEMLEQMGYRHHPALKGGRVNNTVMPDGGKPVLFVHEHSMAMQITSAAEAAKHYESSNVASRSLPFARHG